MTPINRQSYMAEISSLLGLITDENTREVLISKMERMFDAAEDEQALIEDIGSPTKVAVALIRYADNGVVTPEAAAVIETVTDDEPEHSEDFDTLEALDEQPELLIPETEAPETPEAEAETPSEPEPEAEAEEPVAEPEADVPAEPEAAEPDEPESAEEAPLDPFAVFVGSQSEEPEPVSDESEPVSEEPEAVEEPAPEEPSDTEETSGGFFTEATDLLEEPEPETPSEDVDTFVEDAPEFDADDADDELSEEEAEWEPDSDSDEDEETFSDEDYAEADAYDASKLPPELGGEDDEDEEEGPLTITKVNTFLAILYFIIPGLVIGLPVFLVLLVLNLAFLAVAAVVLTAAVLLAITGFAPLTLADRLLCFGSAAASLAVGLVLLWFTIWFFVCVTCGWVRLMTRGGKRLSRKEVEIE